MLVKVAWWQEKGAAAAISLRQDMLDKLGQQHISRHTLMPAGDCGAVWQPLNYDQPPAIMSSLFEILVLPKSRDRQAERWPEI